MMANEFERKLRKHNVTASQWSVLAVLWEQDGIAQVELQRLLHLDGATVTGLVKRMTHWGVVRRETDPRDKRVQHVYLTEQGRRLESVLIPEAESVNAQTLQGFSEEEVALLIDLLSRALKNLS
ncbi:MAG TPA: MarR family transcriptional regulator [Ktedonobacteraceae bacterium]